uniref:G protein-coupled receptor n=1 Tax=Acrobeloides nanus TaxID=290746 RepID=A0A914DXY4_9BILA
MIGLHFVGGTPILIAAAPSFYDIGVKDHDYWWNYMDRNFPSSMVPLICYMAPFIYSAVDVIIQFQIPTILTILIQLSTLHSFFNAITMILLMKPYRRAVRDAFRMKCIFNQVSGSNLVVASTVRVNNLVVTNNEKTK